MTRPWMDVLPGKEAAPPHSYCTNWFVGQQSSEGRSGSGSGSGSWSQEENKWFEDALAKFDGDTPDRWAKVAALIPGKTVGDVVSHYRELVDDVTEIEAGRIPCPVYYGTSSFTLDWENSRDSEAWKNSYCVGGGGGGAKRSGARSSDHERKKGVPWTEDEHKLFLLGLRKYGKGDWRNISRNFVITRTPTQVASHAQKYFIRLNSGSKDKRRSSIHDITSVDFPDNRPPSPSSQPSTITTQSSLALTPSLSGQFSAIADPDQLGEVASGFSPSSHGHRFMQCQFGTNPFGMNLHAQNPDTGKCDQVNLGIL